MVNWKRIGLYAGIAVVVLGLLYIAFYFVFLNLLVDLWWFRSLQFEGYFWLRLLYRYFVSGGFTLLFFAIFFLHFWIASRYLGYSSAGNAGAQRGKLITAFQTGAMSVYVPLSLILAVIVALPLYHQWELALLYLYGGSAGVIEPVFGNDVGFHLFSYPFYQLIQKELLATAGLIFLAVGVLYWVEHRVLAPRREVYPLGARVHLTVLIFFVFLFVTWGFMLQRFALLYTDHHEPVYYGPGFVELRYLLPLIWAAIIAFLAAAISAVVLIHSDGGRGKTLLKVFSVLFVVAFGLRYVELIPNMIKQFIVDPNPVRAEKPFMAHNIKATSDAYGLDQVETIDFTVNLTPEDDLATWLGEGRQRNIPVWDRELLDDVYRQLQGIRPYYNFPTVDEDRYTINGELQQVNIAARELSTAKLPLEARNWENQHLRYTHGYGAVVTPAAQAGGNPMEWYLRDLNLYSPVGLKIAKPDIYYGLERLDYAIVPNKLNVVGISASSGESSGEFAGTGGVPIPSMFRKMLFAFYYREEKIFFSTNIDTRSRVLLRRHIKQRIHTLTPFFALDSDPYLVAGRDRFYWIQDGYILSDNYPVSKYSDYLFKDNVWDLAAKRFNYIRNAVKIVVDAYDGSVDYYIADSRDPMVRTYANIYPGLLKNIAKMPEFLRSHLRYPRDLLEVQLKIYAKYHQTEPELFYQQAETWEFAEVDGKTVKPYYLTVQLENCQGLEQFVLINPMTPIKRDNLSVLAVAGPHSFKDCGPEYQQRLAMYKFRKDVQVDGPSQVLALIDQAPEISEQFTLWDQHGSTVMKGRMIILPMATSVLYVLPVYLISTAKTKIPELVRVIVSTGNVVAMERTLQAAFESLRVKLSELHGPTALPPQRQPVTVPPVSPPAAVAPPTAR